jgi:MFS transporter, MHS family, proline/betaine transporter
MEFSKKHSSAIIFAVTIGNLLEWYEIYLYVYWAPIIARLFFNSSSDVSNLTNAFLVFAVGFLARPLGGIFFGRIGDRIGRKKALVLSITMMIFPTFITGLLPTYAQIGWMAPIVLGVMRFLQSFPAGGELPGAFCYLYESSSVHKRRFMSSWAAFGYQLGILICTVECYLLERFLSAEDLINWGWRLSFLIGGLIGFCGLYLRYKLHETPLYREMLSHEHIVKEPILQVFTERWKKIVMGIAFCALNSSAFYLLSINFPVYFSKVLKTSYANDLFYTILFLILITVPLPYFGRLADKYNNKKLLIFSTLGIILLLYPLYYAINHESILFMIFIMIAFGLFFTMLSALVPYIVSDLFPTYVRFTCVGLSFNIADSVIGGFTPFIAMLLLTHTKHEGSFVWFILLTSVISLVSYILMSSKKSIPHPLDH